MLRGACGAYKGPQGVRDSVFSLDVKLRQSFKDNKRDTKSRCAAKPRGVSSLHVYYRAFGDALHQTWIAGHATFVFRAGVEALGNTEARERKDDLSDFASCSRNDCINGHLP